MYQIAIHFQGQVFQVSAEKNETILTVLQRNGFPIYAGCAGQGKCGHCKIHLDGKEVLACQAKIDADCMVLLNGSVADTEVESATELSGINRGRFAFAVDLGTTTVAVARVDPDSGEVQATRACENRQRSFGADIISRLRYARKKEGLKQLQSVIAKQLEGMFCSLAEMPSEAENITIAGNTAMVYLLAGKDITGLVTPPYCCDGQELMQFAAKDIGISAAGYVPVRLLPPIGGFIGSDISSAIYASKIHTASEWEMLYDLGTNGEISIANQDRILCCGTAAGSALEGVGITCGVGGIQGAIRKLRHKNGETTYDVIGECQPCGLCASGIIDAIAIMLETGVIDYSGRMSQAYKRNFFITPDVFLTNRDVREIQLAKAAVAAGAVCLIRQTNISWKDISCLKLAGAFGSSVDISSACRIGLIPSELECKTSAVGNAALEGVTAAACREEALREILQITRRAKQVDLSQEKDFEEEFIQNINFSVGS